MARSTSAGSAKKAAPKKKGATKKATAKTSTSAKKAAPAKKSAKRTSAKKAVPAKKSTKASARKAVPKKKSTKTSAKNATAKKATTKNAAPTKKTATRASSQTAPRRGRSSAGTLAPRLVVREDESPWTKSELKSVRAEIEGEVERLREEIEVAEHELVDLMRDHADGAGDDQADQGAKTFEREQEITLTNNARSMLIQNLHALERLEDGSYGQCESCGNAIGKLRLQAYPRATLCVPCKTKQERR